MPHKPLRHVDGVGDRTGGDAVHLKWVDSDAATPFAAHLYTGTVTSHTTEPCPKYAARSTSPVATMTQLSLVNLLSNRRQLQNQEMAKPQLCCTAYSCAARSCASATCRCVVAAAHSSRSKALLLSQAVFSRAFRCGASLSAP